MGYRDHFPSTELLFGYDPERDLPQDHLCRVVDRAVDMAITPPCKPSGPGQPAYDPRMNVKVLVYGYAMGVRSSRRMERCCREDLGFLYLTRGDCPSYRTLCSTRVKEEDALTEVWQALHVIALEENIPRMGVLVVDSSKIRADASSESVVREAEIDSVLAEFKSILEEAAAADEADERHQPREQTLLGKTVKPEHMREILRRVRKQNGIKRAQEAQKLEAQKLDAQKKADGEDNDEAGGDEAGGEVGGDDTNAVEERSDSCSTGPLDTVGDQKNAVSEEPGGEPSRVFTRRMLKIVEQSIATLENGRKTGRKQVSLTDPDGQMMGEGRTNSVRICHSFEVAVDNGLPVLAQRSPDGTDNNRLVAVVKQVAAKTHPESLTESGKFVEGALTGMKVTADSGYYSGGPLLELAKSGVDLCVPSGNVATDLRRGLPLGTTRSLRMGKIPFEFDEANNLFRCPEGNELKYKGLQDHRQKVKLYRAKRSCEGCPLAELCLVQANAKYRTLKIPIEDERQKQQLERFNNSEHRARYHQRGPDIETVFGVCRTTLQAGRWMLRGAEKVTIEASLLGLAYLSRKIQTKIEANTKANRAQAMGMAA